MADNNRQQGNQQKQPDAPRQGRSLADRLLSAAVGSGLKDGESWLDLCIYRNATKCDQIIFDDVGRRIKLPAPGVTDKSIVLMEQGKSEGPPEKFPGGTIILTRRAGTKYVAANIVEFVRVYEAAHPDDFTEAQKD